MNVLIKGNVDSENQIINSMSNCNGQCSSDSGWCAYDPDTNCWDDGD